MLSEAAEAAEAFVGTRLAIIMTASNAHRIRFMFFFPFRFFVLFFVAQAARIIRFLF